MKRKFTIKRKIQISLIIGFILTLAFQWIFVAWNTKKNIQADVLRLHIVANSDSEEDQSVKLKIRNNILHIAQKENWFDSSATLEENISSAKSRLAEAENIANETLEENNFDYTATAELTDVYFDERIYDEYTFPAGIYEAFRITLGDAKGHNWWCVMYPQMCIPFAEDIETDEKTAEEYFSEDEIDLLKNPQKYKFRLKCVEWAEKIIEKIKG